MTSGTKNSSRYHPDYSIRSHLRTSNKVLPGNGGDRASLMAQKRSQGQLGNQITQSLCSGLHHPPALCIKSGKDEFSVIVFMVSAI